MAYGDEDDFGWCNLFIKFALFIMNMILLLMGCVLLAVGIFAQIEAGTLDDYGAGDILASPAIFLIILGGIMFILGFSGCLGALREVYFLLVIYCIIMTLLVIVEIGCGAYVYLMRDNTRARIEERMEDYIVRYYDNPDLQNIIDLTQQNLECCGAGNGPNDWQANVYFNCSSVAFQRCSVPFSCCIPPEGEDEIFNVQCGYRTLNASDTNRFQMGIYIEPCVTALETLINEYLYYIAGFIIGLLVFQLINILLMSGLAIDVRKEQKALKVLKKRENNDKRISREMNKI